MISKLEHIHEHVTKGCTGVITTCFNESYIQTFLDNDQLDTHLLYFTIRLL